MKFYVKNKQLRSPSDAFMVYVVGYTELAAHRTTSSKLLQRTVLLRKFVELHSWKETL